MPFTARLACLSSYQIYTKAILTSGRQVQIRTFHSWFAALLRSAPLALLEQMELPANYELLEDDAPAKALVWRRFYAALLAQGQNQNKISSPAGARFSRPTLKPWCLTMAARRPKKPCTARWTSAPSLRWPMRQGVVDASVQHFSDQYPEFAWLQTPDEYLTAQPQRLQTLWAAAKALGGASAKTFAAKGVELEMALTQRRYVRRLCRLAD
jgi:ATP-dependent helicase/nuclease subunit A